MPKLKASKYGKSTIIIKIIRAYILNHLIITEKVGRFCAAAAIDRPNKAPGPLKCIGKIQIDVRSKVVSFGICDHIPISAAKEVNGPNLARIKRLSECFAIKLG